MLVSVTAVLAGQLSLGLFSMDDLREAEVAREMLETGDVLIPHLAGRPFVEKPPGFQILVALAFRAGGGPGVAAARLVSAGFALLSVLATYLLGRRIAGALAGALSALLLASSALFCRVAHSVLLDNALVASLAWATCLGWIALDEEDLPRKRRLYAAALGCVSLSFLFKGFVGPAIAGAGFLSALGAMRRWGELRHILHPAPIGAFLGPLCVWMIPFVLRAPGPLLHEFFISNHLGRALDAYDSHGRPFYFYLATLWAKFLPASILLPFAVGAAWKGRAETRGRAPLYLLFVALGGLLLLSLSRAKDNVYLLPIYPALAVLVGAWAAEFLRGRGPSWPVALGLAGAALALGAAVGVGASVGKGWAAALTGASIALALGISVGILALQKGDRRTAGVSAAMFLGMAAILCCIPPLSTWYVQSRDPKPALLEIAQAAGDRELLLYRPDDRLRGGCGFYRGRTALEIPEADAVARRLKENPAALLVVPLALKEYPELAAEAGRLGVTLEEERSIPSAGLNSPVALIRVKTPGRDGRTPLPGEGDRPPDPDPAPLRHPR
jgi:4-amino-4-deoxy-L-arabinose transferase-like glycosyltransferase